MEITLNDSVALAFNVDLHMCPKTYLQSILLINMHITDKAVYKEMAL